MSDDWISVAAWVAYAGVFFVLYRQLVELRWPIDHSSKDASSE
jgi:hypothetical protein